MNTETDFHIKAEFEQAEMRVSRIVASKAKIPLQAATCAALAALVGDVFKEVKPLSLTSFDSSPCSSSGAF